MDADGQRWTCTHSGPAPGRRRPPAGHASRCRAGAPPLRPSIPSIASRPGPACRAGAVASGVALLLAVIAVQHYAVGVRQHLIPTYERLNAELPDVTILLVVRYPGALGFMAILASAAWLVSTFFVRRGTVVVVTNSALLLAVVLFVMMHGLASVLPFGQAAAFGGAS